MNVEPYLVFNGRCEAALAFYQATLGAQVEALLRFSDAPPEAIADCPGDPGRIMHARLRIGDNVVMASDGGPEPAAGFGGFALTLALEDEAEAARHFEALAEGGQVSMPFGPTFFAHQFGMLNDRFGVPWMVIVPRPM
jgi:PhnB protein